MTDNAFCFLQIGQYSLHLPLCQSQRGSQYFCCEFSILLQQCQHFIFICCDIYYDIMILILTYFFQRIPDHSQHEFDKYRGITGSVGTAKHIIVFFLMFMHQRFHREPCEDLLPVLKNQRMPEPACASIPIRKGMNKLKLIVEDTAFHQRMQLGFLQPGHQLRHQIRNILRRCSSMNQLKMLSSKPVIPTSPTPPRSSGRWRRDPCGSSDGSRR